MSEDELDPVFKALSDPTRRKILDLLNTTPKTTSELSASFKLSRFAIMKHLRVLEGAGLIVVRREGRHRFNHLDATPLARVYDRWLSRQTAWTPTLEGSSVQAPDVSNDDDTNDGRGPARGPENAAEDPTSAEDEALHEIYLIVRPEERYPVERAIQSIVPPVYTVMNATGRGAYWGDAEGGRRKFGWRRKEQLAQFLPKTILFLVVPQSYVAPILRAVGSALRLQGGPEDCGTGFAAVLPLGEEVVLGADKKAAPQTRATAEGW